MPTKEKVVLAYSGGLDTSVILKWLAVERGYDVVTFTADIGQGDDSDGIEIKARKSGACKSYVEDLREEFVRDYVFPVFRCNAQYEGDYLLGTSCARPLIAKRQVQIAKETKAVALSHGATGKGNDQVRFELSYYANFPGAKVIAPWREWDLSSRTKLLDFAKQNNIPIASDNSSKPPYSMDANLLHLSIEGNDLECPEAEAGSGTYITVRSVKDAPDTSEVCEIEFHKGDPVALNGKKMKPHTLLAELNKLGAKHGIGRIDIIENRFIGMKSRGVYETPGGTIMLQARKALESITLDKGAMHLKNEIMPKYAELIYNGLWFAPEREMLQALIDKSQEFVTGHIKLELYKGNVIIKSRASQYSLFSKEMVTFEEDEVYSQRDAEGFIKLNALRLRILGERSAKISKGGGILSIFGK